MAVPPGGPGQAGRRGPRTASGRSPVRWSASTAAPWLYFSQSSGTLRPGESITIKVYVDPLREPSGYWTARVAISPAGAVVSIAGYGTAPAPSDPGPAPVPSTPAGPPPSSGPDPTPTPTVPTDPPSSRPPPSPDPEPTPSATTPSDPAGSPPPSGGSGDPSPVTS